MAHQKLRAGERRDSEMVAFCERMAKQSKNSSVPSERRDAGYWLEMAAYYRDTEQFNGPVRRLVPNTRHLDFLVRAGRSIEGAQAVEIASLRASGVSWQLIADSFGLTRQGVQRRWAEVVAPLVDDLMADGDSAEFDRLQFVAQAEELVERVIG